MKEENKSGYISLEQDLANNHWIYTKKIIDKMVETMEMLYKQAMIHGYKHGKEQANDKEWSH